MAKKPSEGSLDSRSCSDSASGSDEKSFDGSIDDGRVTAYEWKCDSPDTAANDEVSFQGHGLQQAVICPIQEVVIRGNGRVVTVV